MQALCLTLSVHKSCNYVMGGQPIFLCYVLVMPRYEIIYIMTITMS